MRNVLQDLQYAFVVRRLLSAHGHKNNADEEKHCCLLSQQLLQQLQQSIYHTILLRIDLNV